MKNFLLAFTFAVLLSPSLLYGQEIITDRPDQTESADIVKLNSVQFETGLSIEEDNIDNGGIKNSSATSGTLIRYGILSNMELRMAFEYTWQETKTAGSVGGNGTIKQNGLMPVEFGAKIKITEEKGALPSSALLFHVAVPKFADAGFFNEYTSASFRFCMSHELSDRFAVAYNLGGEWDGNSPAASGIYTLSLGAGIVKNLSSFLEVYGSFTEKGEPQHSFDGGLTYLLSRNFQIDISGGAGITENAPDYFFGGGFAGRLPR